MPEYEVKTTGCFPVPAWARQRRNWLHYMLPQPLGNIAQSRSPSVSVKDSKASPGLCFDSHTAVKPRPWFLSSAQCWHLKLLISKALGRQRSEIFVFQPSLPPDAARAWDMFLSLSRSLRLWQDELSLVATSIANGPSPPTFTEPPVTQ